MLAEQFKLKPIQIRSRSLGGAVQMGKIEDARQKLLEKLRLIQMKEKKFCECEREPHLITCEECGELYCTKCEEHFDLCPCLEVDDV